MRLLFIGDVMGRSGREAVAQHLPGLIKDLDVDFTVVNGENAASGFGITAKICAQLFENGADVVTGGNHSWDQRDIMNFIDGEPRLLRPINYPRATPGRGAHIYTGRKGHKVLVMNAMGRLFMDPLDDPFAAVDLVMQKCKLGTNVDAAFLDFHAEATSEKMAMGHFLDGRVSLVVGTHTHVPTGDAQVLSGGTAYQTDAGMCGDYDSVIGMNKQAPIHRFTRKTPGERLSPALGEGTLCGVLVETIEGTGLAKDVWPIRVGPRLKTALPGF